MQSIKNEEKVIRINSKTAFNDSKQMLRDVIRKFKVGRDHVYISNNAQKLWNNIMVKNDMYNYQYTDRIICTKKSDSKVKLYKSNENKSFSTTTLSLGNEYKYNNIFHDDHMILLSVLINRLTSYDRINEKEVNELFDNIYICKMLKEEDRNIGKKYRLNRPYDIDEIKRIYKDNGVEIKK